MIRRSSNVSNSSVRVGLDLRIETPENVILTYQLAGPAIRLWAYLIDLIVRFVAMGILTFALVLFAIALPGFSMGLLLVIIFLNAWGYFVICEGLFKGKTIGKHVFGLRVIQEQGYPVTFWSALLRNLIRAVDALPLYGPGFVSMVCSRNLQRIGDLVAGTVVIQERRIGLPRQPFILEKIRPLSRDDIGTFVPSEQTLSLIEQFMGRRTALTHARGHALAFTLAHALAKRFDYQGDVALIGQYPMAFLARVYVTFHKRREDDETVGTSAPHSAPSGQFEQQTRSLEGAAQ